MSDAIGRLFTCFGLAMVVVVLLLQFGPPLPWIGKLPGDIQIDRGSFRLVFPLGTCLAISVVLTLVLQLFSRLR